MPRKATKKKAKKRTTKKRAKKTSKPAMHPQTAETIVVVKKESPKPKHGKLKHIPKAEEWFVLCSGKEIKNLRELAQDLGEMEDFVFGHHVNEHKNDFVNWIKDIFEDPELAEKISPHKDKKKMQVIVYEHIIDKLW